MLRDWQLDTMMKLVSGSCLPVASAFLLHVIFVGCQAHAFHLGRVQVGQGIQPVPRLTTAPFSRSLKQILPFLPAGSVPIVLASGPAAIDLELGNSTSSLYLAEHRTRRPDILSNFREYRGGWNITNKHYWTSVGVAGAPGFILAFLWFTLFGFVLVRLHSYRKGSTKEQQPLPASYCFPLLMLSVFTCTTIVGCILLSIGQDKFHYEISNALQFVVSQSDITVENLRNVSSYLNGAKKTRVAQFVIPYDKQKQIEEINGKLVTASDELEEKTYDNAEKIQKALNLVRDSLLLVAAVMLFLAIIGLLLAVLGRRHIIYVLILFGWFLVAGTLILCGIFIILNIAIADSCVAMKEWVGHPDGETTLDHILPCVNRSTSNQALYKSKEVACDLVNITNHVIRDIMKDTTAQKMTRKQMPELCIPFDYALKDRPCLPQEVNFTNAAEVWKNYTCVGTSSNCSSAVITEMTYVELTEAVNLSYGLVHYSPFLLNLIDCTFVRDTFETIIYSYCPDLTLYVKWVWVGLALISVGVMLSLIFWIIQVFWTVNLVLKGNRIRLSDRRSRSTSGG